MVQQNTEGGETDPSTFFTALVHKPFREAIRECHAHGWSLRVTRLNGRRNVRTYDTQSKRVNVAVQCSFAVNYLPGFTGFSPDNWWSKLLEDTNARILKVESLG